MDTEPEHFRIPSSIRLEYAYVRNLLQAKLIARLASRNSDGTVHLTAVWFLYEGRHLLIPTFSASRKVRNVRADPRVTVLVDRAMGGFDVQGVMMAGRASILEGVEASEINRRIHLKYLRAEALDSPRVRGAIRDDVTIALRPRRVVSWDDTTREVAETLRENNWFHSLD